MVNGIIDTIISLLKAEPGLAGIKEWKKTCKAVTAYPAIGVDCSSQTFEVYDRIFDQATVAFTVSIFANDADVETRQALIRELAQKVRQVLSANSDLAGIVASGFVREISYKAAETVRDVHMAVVGMEITYLVQKHPETTAPKVARIILTSN